MDYDHLRKRKTDGRNRPANLDAAGNIGVMRGHVVRKDSGIGSRDAETALYWAAEERLNEVSTNGGPLEMLAAAVDFERFR